MLVFGEVSVNGDNVESWNLCFLGWKFMIFYIKITIGLHNVAYFMHCVSGLDLLMEQRLKTYHISAAILNLTYSSSLMLYEDSGTLYWNGL